MLSAPCLQKVNEFLAVDVEMATYLDVVNYSYVVAVVDRRGAHPTDMFVLTDPMMEITIAKKYEKYFAKSFAPIMLLYWIPQLTVHDEEKMNDLYYSEPLVTHSVE